MNTKVEQLLVELAEFRISALVEQERIDADGDIDANSWDDEVHIVLRNVRKQ